MLPDSRGITLHTSLILAGWLANRLIVRQYMGTSGPRRQSRENADGGIYAARLAAAQLRLSAIRSLLSIALARQSVVPADEGQCRLGHNREPSTDMASGRRATCCWFIVYRSTTQSTVSSTVNMSRTVGCGEKYDFHGPIGVCVRVGARARVCACVCVCG